MAGGDFRPLGSLSTRSFRSCEDLEGASVREVAEDELYRAHTRGGGIAATCDRFDGYCACGD